jgi:hypothetical protein
LTTSWNLCVAEGGKLLVNPFDKWYVEGFWKPFLRSVRKCPFNKNLSTVGTDRLNANFDRSEKRRTARSRVTNIYKVGRWLEALEMCKWTFKLCHTLQNFKLHCKIRGLYLT